VNKILTAAAVGFFFVSMGNRLFTYFRFFIGKMDVGMEYCLPIKGTFVRKITQVYLYFIHDILLLLGYRKRYHNKEKALSQFATGGGFFWKKL
jgi:hypothetical protein